MDPSILTGTIVALSTPPGEGGVALVRMTGPESVAIAESIFRPGGGTEAPFKSHRLYHGHVLDGREEVIDEVMLSVMLAPRSYTREDVVEISCHGGSVPVSRIIDLCRENGARLAEPGEFTKRAFLNGRMDLSQAEAVLDMIKSKTDAARRAAVEHLKGALGTEIRCLRDTLLDVLAACEIAIDFSDEDVEMPQRRLMKKDLARVLKALEKLLSSAQRGMVLREGVSVVICGKPNVGKSSLMNLLLKRDRVIVTDIPGTTRDVIQEQIELGGVSIKLSDTAGIIDTEDRVELEGIKRSRRMLEEADAVIFMLDAGRELTERDLGIYRTVSGKKHITVLNKTDLPGKVKRSDMKRCFPKEQPVKMSVRTKRGADKLEKALSELVSGTARADLAGTMLTNLRHKELVSNAASAVERALAASDEGLAEELIASDVREAIMNLEEITGDNVPADVLDRIFANFCIGK